MDVSVLILTLNEEVNLGRCLRSLVWCDDIVVLDSFSTDGNRAVPRSHKPVGKLYPARDPLPSSSMDRP